MLKVDRNIWSIKQVRGLRRVLNLVDGKSLQGRGANFTTVFVDGQAPSPGAWFDLVRNVRGVAENWNFPYLDVVEFSEEGSPHLHCLHVSSSIFHDTSNERSWRVKFPSLTVSTGRCRNVNRVLGYLSKTVKGRSLQRSFNVPSLWERTCVGGEWEGEVWWSEHNMPRKGKYNMGS